MPVKTWPRPNRDEVLQEIREQLDRIERNQEALMSQQSTEQNDIDAATAAVTGLETSVSAVAADLQSAEANITAEIEALKAANPSVSTAALDAAVAGLVAPLAALQSADTSVDALETPAAVTPPAGS